jgi:hypothetical protein
MANIQKSLGRGRLYTDRRRGGQGLLLADLTPTRMSAIPRYG